MKAIISLEETEKFIKKYFKTLRIKKYIIWAIIWFTTIPILSKSPLDSITRLGVILGVSILAYFIIPDNLYKETKKAIIGVYKKIANFTDNKNTSVTICNLKEKLGPTFGGLYITKSQISFIPFKSNLQDKKIVLNRNAIKDVEVILIDKKISILDRLLFKDLCKVIKISYNNKIILFQAPNPDLIIKNIKK